MKLIFKCILAAIIIFIAMPLLIVFGRFALPVIAIALVVFAVYVVGNGLRLLFGFFDAVGELGKAQEDGVTTANVSLIASTPIGN